MLRPCLKRIEVLLRLVSGGLQRLQLGALIFAGGCAKRATSFAQLCPAHGGGNLRLFERSIVVWGFLGP